MPQHDGDLEAELNQLIADGRKIEAVKLYRERTGAGLAEASRAIDELGRGEPLPERPAADSQLEWDVVALLENGRKIEAIKLYREQTGAGLKDAKEAVETIAAERGIAASTGGGCLGMLALIALTALAGAVGSHFG